MNKKFKNKKTITNLIIIILITVSIIGIWLIKNNDNVKENNENNISSENNTTSEKTFNVTDNFNLGEITSQGLPVIIDFGSDSCIPCKEMAPALKELNEEMQGKAIIKFVDIWKNPDAANNLPIKVIPTQFFFDKNGKPYTPKNIDNIMEYSDNNTNEHVFTTHEGGLTKEQMTNILKELGIDD